MNNVSVLIVDRSLEGQGVVANLALVLGLTAGRLLPDHTFGEDVQDGDGRAHVFLTNIGHVVRKAGQSKLRRVRDALADDPDVRVVDYTEDAAPADYRRYAESLGGHTGEEIRYRGVWVWGPEEVVGPLTRNLSRLG